MALSVPDTLPAPWWPAGPVDPAEVDVDYDSPADELTLYCSGRPHAGICDPIEGPGFEDVAVIYDEGTGEIVGVQVIPLLLGAVRERPDWAALAWAAMAGDFGTELLKERLPGFPAEVADAFRRYWTPPPPIEEQLARLTRSDRQEVPDEAAPADRPAGAPAAGTG